MSELYSLIYKGLSNIALSLLTQSDFRNPKNSSNVSSKHFISAKFLYKSGFTALCSTNNHYVATKLSIVRVAAKSFIHPFSKTKSIIL